MYRAFQSPNPNDTGRLQLHFIKENHDVVVREKKSVKLHQGWLLVCPHFAQMKGAPLIHAAFTWKYGMV